MSVITAGQGLRRSIEIFDLPYDDDGKFLYRPFRDLLIKLKIDSIWVENVWPRSKRAPNAKDGMGFTTGAKFMKAVGATEGIAACFVDDCHLVVPAKWMEMFGLLKLSAKQKQDLQRETIVDLFFEAAPAVRRAKDEGRAASALIATYGCVKLGLFSIATG